MAEETAQPEESEQTRRALVQELIEKIVSLNVQIAKDFPHSENPSLLGGLTPGIETRTKAEVLAKYFESSGIIPPAHSPLLGFQGGDPTPPFLDSTTAYFIRTELEKLRLEIGAMEARIGEKLEAGLRRQMWHFFGALLAVATLALAANTAITNMILKPVQPAVIEKAVAFLASLS